MIFLPKLNQRNVHLVHQDKTCGVQAFVHRPEELKGRRGTSSMDAKGPLVHHTRLSVSAGKAKGYLAHLAKTWRAHDKSLYH